MCEHNYVSLLHLKAYDEEWKYPFQQLPTYICVYNLGCALQHRFLSLQSAHSIIVSIYKRR